MTSFLVGRRARDRRAALSRPPLPAPAVSVTATHARSWPVRSSTGQAELDVLRAELAAARAEVAATRAEVTELRRREAFHTAMLETVEVGVITCGADGSDWTRNRTSRVLLGLVAEDGRHLSPEDAAPQIDVLTTSGHPIAPHDYPVLRALRGEDAHTVDLLIGPNGGRHREIQSVNQQVRGPDGQLLGAVTVLSDVTEQRTSLRSADEDQRQLVEAQRIGQLGSFELDGRDGRWQYSQALTELWGATACGGPQPLSQRLVHPEDRGHTQARWVAALRQGGRHTFEHRILRADDGAERRVRCNVEVQLRHDGRVSHVRGTNLDVTELRAAESTAQEATAFREAVLAASPDYTFVSRLADGAVVYSSRDVDILGLSARAVEELGAQAAATLVHPDDVPRLKRVVEQSRHLADGAVLATRYRARHADGGWRWLNRRVTPFHRDASGTVTEVVGVVRDITDAVAQEERLQHASLHDPLTGLPNRALLRERLESALDAAAGREVALLFCDLDGFKDVNDTAGHAAGDAVLRETSRRIASVLREGDTVARVGGDEFVVVLTPGPQTDPLGHDRALAASIAERIGAVVRWPVEHDDAEHRVTASIGLAFSSRAGAQGAEELLARADQLMYDAKRRGKDRVSVLTDS